MKNEIITHPVIRIENDSTCTGLALGYYKVTLPPKIYLCPYSKVEDLVNKGILPVNASIGETYIASPYGDTSYISLHRYESDIISKKAHHVSAIANMLGASNCEYSVKVVSVVNRQLSGKLKAQSAALCTRIDANLKNEIEEKIKHSISVKTLDKGSIPSPEAYDQAMEYAINHNLQNDESVWQLLNTRNPKSPHTNWRRECDIKVHLCQEINDNLDVAASLGVMEDVFDFDFNFIQAILHKKEVNLELSYTFPIPD